MIFSSTVPILYSTDVRKSLNYYVNILGFENHWEWEDPPTFGGVSKNSVEIFFCKEGQGNPGSWIAIMVNNVDEYYESIKTKGAKILIVPKTMEWGMREMLVEDPDGHIIRFGHGASPEDEKREKSSALPETVRIITTTSGEPTAQKPVPKNFPLTVEEAIEYIPVPVTIAFFAEDTAIGQVIGSVFLSTDTTGVYYVKSLSVHPDWQSKHIGSALMQELSDWLEKKAPDKAYIGLHCPPGLAHFYKHFGFAPAHGMYRSIKR